MSSICLPCRRGFPEECEADQPPCAAPVAVVEPESESEGDSVPGRNINTYKRDSKLKDQQSTGRKRAAIMFPLNEGEPCEWRGLKSVGGGVKPINGCVDGLQMARHHGPDKNTLSNEVGNVHRICHHCHNRWHTENDEGYDWTGLHNPHNPTGEMTKEELVENEVYWAGRGKLKTTKD